jgi:hypothetical protein
MVDEETEGENVGECVRTVWIGGRPSEANEADDDGGRARKLPRGEDDADEDGVDLPEARCREGDLAGRGGRRARSGEPGADDLRLRRSGERRPAVCSVLDECVDIEEASDSRRRGGSGLANLASAGVDEAGSRSDRDSGWRLAASLEAAVPLP